MDSKIQRKIRQLTSELAKVLYMRISNDFNDPLIMKSAMEIYTKLKSNASSNAVSINDMNRIEENLRNLITIIYQKVFQKAPPTNLLYFSGLKITVTQTNPVDFECVAYRKILLQFLVISVVLAYIRTSDQDFLKIFKVLHKINISAMPNDKVDKYGNAYLARASSILLLANKENISEIKEQVFRLLNVVS